jgi:two-component system, cell cycle sensor histidine kinase and response regulator CckA
MGPGNYLKLVISDTGHGIDDEILPRIFDPFFTNKKPGEGTGMGLAVVHGIVKSHSGAIKVESEKGKGTSFQIYLPLLDKRSAPLENAPRTPPRRGQGTVLVVDDEEALAEVASLMLSKLGYQVVTAAGSIEALEIFNSSPDRFDLVLTDMAMPGMTGIELAMEMMRRSPGLPVILATGFSDLIDKRKALEMGLKDHVMKPYTTWALADAVNRALEE